MAEAAPPSGSNGNLSVKELVLMLNGKIDAYIVSSEQRHNATTSALQEVRLELARHDHEDIAHQDRRITAIESWVNRRQGNVDVLKALVGTSALVSIVSIAVSVLALVK